MSRILFIDDKRGIENTLLMKSLIAEGHKIIFVDNSSDEALRLLRNEATSIDIIIQNMLRPVDECLKGKKHTLKLAGIGFYEHYIRRYYSHIPCVFRSAQIDRHDVRLYIASLSNVYSASLWEPDSISVIIRSLSNEKEHIYETSLTSYEIGIIQVDLSRVTQELLDNLAVTPELLYEISPRRFEELIAELLERDGFNVLLTPATRDGGFDILAEYTHSIGTVLSVIECKRFARGNPVGIDVVRSLYGVKMAKRAHIGVVVTTSFFTAPALSFRKTVGAELSLRDYDFLKQWINLAKESVIKPSRLLC